MRAGRRISLILAFAVASTWAGAQTMPGPTDPSHDGGIAPREVAPASCMSEFHRLRGDVEKESRALKALLERRPLSEDTCGQITNLSTAESKWVRFTEANVADCGITAEIVQQLKTMYGHTEQMREKICAVRYPFVTPLVPTPERTKSGPGNTLD
jgi:hypothetical protein